MKFFFVAELNGVESVGSAPNEIGARVGGTDESERNVSAARGHRGLDPHHRSYPDPEKREISFHGFDRDESLRYFSLISHRVGVPKLASSDR